MKDTTRGWAWFLLTGVVILILLGLHMAVMHMDDLLGIFTGPGGATAWGNVLARSRSAFFMITYVVLLAAALYHGLYGFRTIIFEWGVGEGAQRAVTGLFWVAGLGVFGLGSYATVVTFLQKGGL